MSQIVVEDPVWQAILADPELTNARRKLSFHEIRQIIRHATKKRDLTGIKLTAEPVPYSSIVGGWLVLKREDGRAGFVVNFIGTSEGITKEETAELSEQFARFVNDYGVSVQPRSAA